MSRTSKTATVLALAATLATGCDVLDSLTDEQSVIHVFTTHHATPEDGVIPDRGGEGENRVFETDRGWRITLADAFIVTQELSLERCDGNEVPVDLFHGPLPEDLRQLDLELSTVGAAYVKPSTFCSLRLAYGPFDAEAAEFNAPMDPVDGATVYLRGLAEKGEHAIPFQVESNQYLDVVLDLSEVDEGQPFRAKGGESFPLELTLSKTYDRFFDGLDFVEADDDEITRHVMDALDGHTRVDTGTIVSRG